MSNSRTSTTSGASAKENTAPALISPSPSPSPAFTKNPSDFDLLKSHKNDLRMFLPPPEDTDNGRGFHVTHATNHQPGHDYPPADLFSSPVIGVGSFQECSNLQRELQDLQTNLFQAMTQRTLTLQQDKLEAALELERCKAELEQARMELHITQALLQHKQEQNEILAAQIQELQMRRGATTLSSSKEKKKPLLADTM